MTQGPYKLPPGWCWVRLGEVSEINPRRPGLHVDSNEPTTFVPMTAVDDGAGKIISPEVRPFEHVRKGYTYFEEGDVLFAKITPCMENGKAGIARGLLNGYGFASTEFHVLRPGSTVIPEWVWLFIRQEHFRKSGKASFRGGVGQQRVPQEFLERQPIPLPPLEEQHRIVARIEELMGRVREAKRLRQEAQKDADRLMQAALAEVFPRIGSNLPPAWRWVRLGEVSLVFAGSSAPQGNHYFMNGKYVFVRVSDLASAVDGFITQTRDAINEAAIKRSRPKKASAGTILFPKSGAAIMTNARAMLSMDAYIVSHLAALEANQSVAEPRWVFFFLRTIDMGKYIDNLSYPSLKLSRIRALSISLPPLEEQRRIVAHLEAVQEKVKAIKEAQARTDEDLRLLEQAILDRAFRGEL